MSETIWVCADCGSPDVQVTAWVTANGNKVLPDDSPNDWTYCPRCRRDVYFREIPADGDESKRRAE